MLGEVSEGFVIGNALSAAVADHAHDFGALSFSEAFPAGLAAEFLDLPPLAVGDLSQHVSCTWVGIVTWFEATFELCGCLSILN